MEGRQDVKRGLQIPLRERSPDYFRRLVRTLRSESLVGRSDVFSSDEHISRVMEEVSREFPLEPDVIDLDADLRREHRLHPAPVNIPDGDDNIPEILVMPPAVIEHPRHDDVPPSDAYALSIPDDVMPQRPELRRRTLQQTTILTWLRRKILFFGGLTAVSLINVFYSSQPWRTPTFRIVACVCICSIAVHLVYSAWTDPGEPPREERIPRADPNRSRHRRTNRK